MSNTIELINEINKLKSQAKAMSTSQNFLNCAFNVAKSNIGGNRNPNAGEILIGCVTTIEESLRKYLKTNPSSPIKSLEIHENQANGLAAICKKANDHSKSVGYGAGGAALGGALFGWVGAIVGGIFGAAAGNSSTQNDKALFQSLLNDLIEYYFSCLHQNNYLYVEQIGSTSYVSYENPIINIEQEEIEKKCDGKDPSKAEERLNELIGLSSIKRQVMLMKASLKKHSTLVKI